MGGRIGSVLAFGTILVSFVVRLAVAQEYAPGVAQLRVGLQCDVAANRAYVRVGGADGGSPGRYEDLPAEGSPSTAPIVDADIRRDVECRWRDGTEVRLRLYRFGFDALKQGHHLTLWVGRRRVFAGVAVGYRAESLLRSLPIHQSPAHRLGWVITPTRIDVCIRADPHAPGPATQCRIVGDTRLMGIRDWIEYPADGSRPRRGHAYIQYAVDPDFCRSFIRRGTDGEADELAAPAYLTRPVFVDDAARFDFDNDGVLDDVKWWRKLLDNIPLSTLHTGQTDKGAWHVRDVFFHRGRTYVLVSGGPEFGTVREPPNGRVVCRFRRVGG